MTSYYVWPLFAIGACFSIYCWVRYGEGDYGSFTPSGPYRVGFKNFKSAELGNECSMFYPAAPDGSGRFGVPFAQHGQDSVLAMRVVMAYSKPVFANNPEFLMARPFLSIRVPVWEDANLGVKEMQPIVFSHAFHSNRMVYSGLCMELASCGFCVITLNHDDRTCDYTEKSGLFDTDHKAHEFEIRNLQIKIRENEVLALSDEVMKLGFLKTISLEWHQAKLSRNLVLMGQSFGGITVLGASADCEHAKAVISLDPWFFPKLNDKLTTRAG